MAAKAEQKQGKKCPECGIIMGRGKKHNDTCTSRSASKVRPKGDLLDQIDGRTKISTLLKLQARIEEVLAAKEKSEVRQVKDALANVDKLRQQLAEAESLIA